MARVLDNIEWLELGKVLSSNKKRAIRGRTKPLGHPFPFYQFQFCKYHFPQGGFLGYSNDDICNQRVVYLFHNFLFLLLK